MRAEINYLGLTVNPLKLSYEFYRDTRKNGKPKTMVLGGTVEAELEANYETMRFLEEMLSIDERHKNWDLQSPTDSESYKKIVIKIYDSEDYNIRTLELLDTYIADFEEVFETVKEHLKNGETNNYVKLKFRSASQIINKGVTKNVFGWWLTNPFVVEDYKSPIQTTGNTDQFYLSIKHLTKKKTFVPLGIPAFSGTPENKNIEFEIEITENDIDEFQVEVLHDNKVIQNYYSGRQTLDEVVVTAKGLGNSSSSNATSNQKAQSNYPKGKYSIKWDGFDSNGIYDSTIFTTGKLKARIKGKRNGKEKTAESNEFSFKYEEVQWVDTKINRNTKSIDVTLRVNLKDGGEIGTEKDCYKLGKLGRAPEITICPWDKIPEKDLIARKPILKTRTKTFEELKEIVLEGINTYWSRRYTNTKGTIINDENWEIIVTAINTEKSEISLDDIPLIYNTNNPWSRSGNPGSSKLGDGNTMDELARLLPDGVVQRISYNVGYIEYGNEWFHDSETESEKEFKETAAHEIGHEILQAYAGNVFSWQHKGSSYYLPQDKKPVGKESFKEEYINRDFMEETKGENYPSGGQEIDLMKYFHGTKPYNFYDRRVANEKDVIGLIWLNKLGLK